MKKRSRIPTSIAVAAVFLTASSAGANHTTAYSGMPVYNTTMYSDATKTTAVGTIMLSYCTYDDVDGDGAQYRLKGTYTMHQEPSMLGYCYYGNLEPIH